MTLAADPERVSRRAEALSLACQRGRGEGRPASWLSRRYAAIKSHHLGTILMLSCSALQGKPNLSRKSVHSGPGGLRRQPAMAVTTQRGEPGHPSKSSLHALRHKVCWVLCRSVTSTTSSLLCNTVAKGLCFRGLVQSGDSDAEMACRCCPAARSSTRAPIWATSMRWVRCVRCRAVDLSDGHHLVSRQAEGHHTTLPDECNRLVPASWFMWLQDTPVDELQMGRLNLKKDLSERTGQLKSLVRGSWVVW
jgi:hypothetical protein